MRAISSTFVCLTLAASLGCATNPVTGKRELSFLSEAQELAIGQQADLQPFGDLQATGGLLQVDAGQATSNPRIWAGGDVASMARFVTEAVGMGKRAALDIDRALRGLPRVKPVMPPRTTLQEIATWYYPHARRPGERRQPPEQRLVRLDQFQNRVVDQQSLLQVGRRAQAAHRTLRCHQDPRNLDRRIERL